MTPSAILLPSVTHMFLVLPLFVLLLIRKKAAVRAGQVNLKEAALNNSAWPAPVVQVSNNIANQFQLPVLFHAACLAFAVTGGTDMFTVGAAWLFVLTRVVHALVHVTTNHIPHRMPAFALGTVILAGLIIRLIVQLLTA